MLIRSSGIPAHTVMVAIARRPQFVEREGLSTDPELMTGAILRSEMP
jgi:hypothetical protein